MLLTVIALRCCAITNLYLNSSDDGEMRSYCEINVNVCYFCNPLQSNVRHVRNVWHQLERGEEELLLQRMFKEINRYESIPSNSAAYSMFTLCSISITSLEPAKSGFEFGPGLQVFSKIETRVVTESVPVSGQGSHLISFHLFSILYITTKGRWFLSDTSASHYFRPYSQ